MHTSALPFQKKTSRFCIIIEHLTLISSSQTSERNTNIASSFELSISRSLAEVFAHEDDEPPKKFKLPKQDL
jgi:hypothetical protein